MGRVFVVFLGLVVAASLLLFLFDLSAVDEIYVEQAAQAAHESRDRADDQITRHCLKLPTPQAQECTYQARNAEQQQTHEENDLAAQRQTAWWTKWMGIAAFIGMSVGIVGAWLIYATYRTSIETAERQLRPYVLFSDLRVEEMENRWRATFEVINNGQTPARLLTAKVGRYALVEDEMVSSAPFHKVKMRNASEGTPVIPKDGKAIFCVDVGKTESPTGEFLSFAAVCEVRYRGVTDAESREYVSQKGRMVTLVKHSGDDYGADHWEIQVPAGVWQDQTT